MYKLQDSVWATTKATSIRRVSISVSRPPISGNEAQKLNNPTSSASFTGLEQTVSRILPIRLRSKPSPSSPQGQKVNTGNTSIETGVVRSKKTPKISLPSPPSPPSSSRGRKVKTGNTSIETGIARSKKTPNHSLTSFPPLPETSHAADASAPAQVLLPTTTTEKKNDNLITSSITADKTLLREFTYDRVVFIDPEPTPKGKGLGASRWAN